MRSAITSTGPMRVYSCKFDGHYPVGAVLVVIAADLAQATALANVEIFLMGLKDKNPTIELEEMKVDAPGVYTLLDGNY